MKKERKSGFKRFLKTISTLLILAAGVYGAQYFFHILDEPFKQFNNYLSAANGVVFKEMLWGVSAGTLIFILILLVFPVFMRNINTRSYFRNLYQGLISAFIFFLSQTIYQFMEKINRFYLLLSIAAVVIITFILIQIMAGLYKKQENQVEFRTQYIAGITAGLIFGVLLQLCVMGIGLLKANIQQVEWLRMFSR